MKQAKDAFVQALQQRDSDVTVVQDGPTFCRMIITRAGDETLVDLAIDSPPQSQPIIARVFFASWAGKPNGSE